MGPETSKAKCIAFSLSRCNHHNSPSSSSLDSVYYIPTTPFADYHHNLESHHSLWHCRISCDELLTFIGVKNCTSDQFTCRSGNGECVALTWMCDDTPDCSDGSDEADCSKGFCMNPLHAQNQFTISSLDSITPIWSFTSTFNFFFLFFYVFLFCFVWKIHYLLCVFTFFYFLPFFSFFWSLLTVYYTHGKK